jgi:transglutaminase-like putative cysteine protease
VVTGRLRLAIHGGLATLAAAAALGSVFDGYGWLFPVLGGIAVVVAVSELVRASPLPAALGPLLAAAAVTCYITAAYAGASAYGQVIPNRDSLHVLATLARQGFHDVHKLSTPVPTHRGLVLIAVVGIAAVALVVDLMVVTMRRAALAGLPLLATFALCTSVAKHGAGWVPFVIGTVGYLWLLLADSRDRLARWGRPLGLEADGRPHFTWSDQDVMPSPLSMMGRRIGLSAIAVGVLVPLLIPGLHGGISRGGNGLGLGHGSSSKFTVNPIVTIQGELTSSASKPLMSVSTDDPNPGYLRMTSLDRFDGTSFAPSTLEQGVEAQVSRGIDAPFVAGPARSVQVSIGGLDVPWLPLPTQVNGVDARGDWRYDPGSNTVFSARTNTDGLTYTANFVHPNPTAAQLEQAVAPDPAMGSYLELPANISQSVRELTAQITVNARTPFDKAIAIQNYLNDSTRFTYDLHVPPSNSSNALADFLLKTRRGFCQQFATAMAVMARIAGVPSRVAVGFTRGQPGPNHTFIVSTHDAHAWPELYLSGYGWLPFEPTPRADGQAQEPSYTLEQAAKGAGQGTGDGSTSPKGGASKGQVDPRFKLNQLDKLADERGQATGTAGSAHGSPNHTRRDVALALLIVLAVALIAPSLVRVGQRRRRWRGATTPVEQASAAWAELRASAIDAKAGWNNGLTPRATVRVLRAEAAGLDAADAAALERIVVAVQRAWYARGAADLRADGLEDDVDDLRRSMLAEAPLGERIVLRMWPRSVIADARVTVSRIASVLDALDMAGAKLRARLRPRHAV